jgi:hypothetical protein
MAPLHMPSSILPTIDIANLNQKNFSSTFDLTNTNQVNEHASLEIHIEQPLSRQSNIR